MYICMSYSHLTLIILHSIIWCKWYTLSIFRRILHWNKFRNSKHTRLHYHCDSRQSQQVLVRKSLQRIGGWWQRGFYLLLRAVSCILGINKAVFIFLLWLVFYRKVWFGPRLFSFSCFRQSLICVESCSEEQQTLFENSGVLLTGMAVFACTRLFECWCQAENFQVHLLLYSNKSISRIHVHRKCFGYRGINLFS
jgi:hypothetical protein